MSTVCSYCEDEERGRRAGPILISRNKTWHMLSIFHTRALHRESGCIEFINFEAWQELKRLREEVHSRRLFEGMFEGFNKEEE